MTRIRRSKWTLPLFFLMSGVGVFVVQLASGRRGDGFVSLGVGAVVAAVLLLGGRSETIRSVRGDLRDERFDAIHVEASAAAALVLAVALAGALVYEWTQGRDGRPYAQLVAIGGATYLLSLVVLRVRR
ncbi:MAG: hypothetical protein QOE36_3728 [Gaiellaceae bacterium]|nr:hypothetical protein [Gaiellaceae bacterium]